MLLIKTEKGQIAFNARSGLFSPCQRAAFILFDGHKLVADVVGTMAPLGLTEGDVSAMLERGFLSRMAPEALSAPAKRDAPTATLRTDQERYLLAKPLATQITAQLGIWGFRLNLAVEAAPGTPALLLLLPNIQAAAGLEACFELERALKG
ncbi:MAG: hypothetical protein QE283_14460 [Rhodoferax sp.]|nr:hypothetical protein [Rhodoferax sp.]